MQQLFNIGIFDSGYGGLNVAKHIVKTLPQYNYIYLGDNARSPYGTRSFDTICAYTYEMVEWLFRNNCSIIILACNTASAKALRTIQQNYLPNDYPNKKVLGVLRPTTETIGHYTQTGHIGILATNGTVASNSYEIEINKFFPNCTVHQQACPMWVPLIENNEWDSIGANYFIEKYVQELLNKNSSIDTLLLACTHYPILENKIKKIVGDKINVVTQGQIVAKSFKDYLHRHAEIADNLFTNNTIQFYSTDNSGSFNAMASLFYGAEVNSLSI